MPQLTHVLLFGCSTETRNEAIQIADALLVHPNVRHLQIRPSFSDLGLLPIVQRLAPRLEGRQKVRVLMNLADAPGDDTNSGNVTAYLEATVQYHAFCFSDINNEQSFRAVLRVLPTLQMRHLHFSFGLDLTVADRLSRLTNALSRNDKLVNVAAVTAGEENDVFADRPDLAERFLQHCRSRDARLMEWVDNSELVPPYLWLEVLALAREAREDELWMSLLAKLGTEAGKRVQNKRKRAKFHHPS